MATAHPRLVLQIALLTLSLMAIVMLFVLPENVAVTAALVLLSITWIIWEMTINRHTSARASQ